MLKTCDPRRIEASLTRVQPQVVPERRRLAEAAAAELAHEGLLERVNAHVRAEVAPGVEAPSAHDALESPAGHRLARLGRLCARPKVGWSEAASGRALVMASAREHR